MSKVYSLIMGYWALWIPLDSSRPPTGARDAEGTEQQGPRRVAGRPQEAGRSSAHADGAQAHGCVYTLGVLVVGVLLFGAYIKAPDFLETPTRALSVVGEVTCNICF